MTHLLDGIRSACNLLLLDSMMPVFMPLEGNRAPTNSLPAARLEQHHMPAVLHWLSTREACPTGATSTYSDYYTTSHVPGSSVLRIQR